MRTRRRAHEMSKEEMIPPPYTVYYVARPRSRYKSKINPATGQQKWHRKDDKSEGGDASWREGKINKPDGAHQVDCATNSRLEATIKRAESESTNENNLSIKITQQQPRPTRPT